ncbi:MAG: hypothetical protein WA842_01070 [Croceibacterium sp.]
MRGMKLALATAALFLGAAALAEEAPQPRCEMTYRASTGLVDLVRKQGVSFPGYDDLCTRLRNGNLGVTVIEGKGVVGDRSYALVAVALYDRSSSTDGTTKATDTTFDQRTDGDAVDETMIRSLTGALEEIAANPESYVRGVRDEQVRLRQALQRPLASAEPGPQVAAGDGPCAYTYQTSARMNGLLQTWPAFSFPGSGDFCRRMAREGVGLRIIEAGGEMAERSYGWVSVGLYDIATSIDGEFRQVVINTNEDHGPQAQETALKDALTGAVTSLARQGDMAFAAVPEEVARLRQAYAN